MNVTFTGMFNSLWVIIYFVLDKNFAIEQTNN